MTYIYFKPEEKNADKKIQLLGQYRSTDDQATFPIQRINVNENRGKAANHGDWFGNEANYNFRFFLTIIDHHLKMIDTQALCMIDLLTEPNYDDECLQGMGLVRR